jgi:DNA-binding NtrC family response regulator
VVDDEPGLAEVVAEMLAPLGFRCDLAETGREARTLLSVRDYDAVLCDLRMPDTDGEALYAWMASERPHLCARTAFVTGDALSPSAGAFLARCGRPVLEKPLAPEEVGRLAASLSAG